MRPRARHGRRAGLARALGLCLALAGGSLVAHAGSGQRALLVQGETLTQGALDPVAEFYGGETLDTAPLWHAAGFVPHDDAQILLYDVQSGDARPVEAADLARKLVSPFQPPTTLGELFSELGTVVLFETPPPASSPDPRNTPRYLVYWPSRPSAVYYPVNESLLLCACGDVDENGAVDQRDIEGVRFALADPTGSPLSARASACCSVTGPSGDCNIADVAVLTRTVKALPPGNAPVCSVALSP